MALLDFIFGKSEPDKSGLEKKVDELIEQLKKMDAAQRESAYGIVKEVRDLRGQEVGGREEVLKRIEAVQEKLQLAVEDYVATDEDVKQMVRNCLKSKAKTFNEIQKETKISPQTLHKYLHAMKEEVEEFNGVYRIVFSSSLVYVNKNGEAPQKKAATPDGDAQLLELVQADAVYGGSAPEFGEQ